MAGICASSAALAADAPTLDAMRERLDAARARISAQTRLYHDPVGPRTWIDGSRLWYCESARDGARRWWLVDAGKEGAAARMPLFDHAALPAPVREVAVGRQDHEAFAV